MRKVILYIASSLDGKIARKDGGIDWLPPIDGEDYGYEPFYESIGTVLMGYKTYELCLTFDEWSYTGKHTYVFSRDTKKALLHGAELSSDPVGFVRDLKSKPGKDIWLVGGGEIVTLLHDAGLIDEYIFAFIPVILGEGIELFPAVKQQVNLERTKQQAYGNGVVMMYYSVKQ